MLSAALAVMRKLGKGDPVQYLRRIDWNDLTKQATALIKEKVVAIRDALLGILDSNATWILSDGAEASLKKNADQLTKILPQIEQGVAKGVQDLKARMNKALDEYTGELPHTGKIGDVKKVKADEIDAPKGNDLKGAKVIKMKQHKVACFKSKKKGKNAEYDRQLQGQQNGINDMTVKEYLDNRKSYKEIGRKGTGAAQAKARKTFKDKLIKKKRQELKKQGIFGKKAAIQAEILANKEMKTLNALHNPDMIAGGKDIVLDLGDASVNKSIGSNWKNKGFDQETKSKHTQSRVDIMDEVAQNALSNLGPDTLMNVNLHRCK